MRISPLVVVAMIVVAVIAFVAYNKLPQGAGGGGSSGSRDPIADELATAAASLNKGTPKMVGAFVRCDSVTVGPGRRLTFYATLTNISRSQVDVGMLQMRMRSQIAMFRQMDLRMQQFRKYDVELRYVFKDKDGVALFEESVGGSGSSASDDRVPQRASPPPPPPPRS
jgi:hypothetical protein